MVSSIEYYAQLTKFIQACGQIDVNRQSAFVYLVQRIITLAWFPAYNTNVNLQRHARNGYLSPKSASMHNAKTPFTLIPPQPCPILTLPATKSS